MENAEFDFWATSFTTWTYSIRSCRAEIKQSRNLWRDSRLFKKGWHFFCWSIFWKNAYFPSIAHCRSTNHWGNDRIDKCIENQLCNEVWKFQYPHWSDEICERPLLCGRCGGVCSESKGALQLELIQSSADLRQSLQLAGSEKFWTREVSHQKFPNSRRLALYVLTMFGSTYTCESAFSHMNAIKTKKIPHCRAPAPLYAYCHDVIYSRFHWSC